VKIGDLVEVKGCPPFVEIPTKKCGCFFCTGKSNRIGYVISVAPRDGFQVMFDCGAFQLDAIDEAVGGVEVIDIDQRAPEVRSER